MKTIQPIVEGPVSKGGQNTPNLSSARPPAPGGSGGNGEFLVVFKPDQDVRLWGEIPAKVLQICIAEGPHVTYQVAWLDGRTRKAEWVNSSEVEPESSAQYLPIGFSR